MLRFIKYLLLACGIAAADQATKTLAESKIEQGQQVELFKGRVVLANVRNGGAAYGFLANHPRLLGFLTFFTIIGLVAKYYKIAKESRLDSVYALSAACIAGGAAGNIINRATKGYVTDFIQLKRRNGKRTAIFNFADVSVALGMALCAIKDLQQ